ncbi:MAG: DUF4124 domain-containing protein [Lysobacter sp.]|nr:DUF4124 domain-containing protein [Lysobacter sp.]
MLRVATLALFLMLLPNGNAMADDQVTIYRCVDAKGKLTLRDSPCVKGQQQQQRSMVRPKDPPPRPVAKTVRVKPAAAAMPAEIRYVVVNPPRPLYECERPDGTRYSSDNDDGNRRWVPLWTLGYPVYRERLALGDRIGAPPPGADAGRGGPRSAMGYGAFYGGGTWVQDDCYPLPQDEVCAQLSDRRSELRRRYFNAMPSERETLGVEERGLNARLRADCGIN